MPIRLKAGLPDVSLRRVRSGKLLMFDPAVLNEEEQPALIGPESEYLEVTDAALKLKSVVQEGATFICPPLVSLERNMAYVIINPEISKILGYTPAYQQLIETGYYGQLEFSTMGNLTDEQIEAIYEAADDYVFKILYEVLD